MPAPIDNSPSLQTWAELGLEASPEGFMQEHYAFTVWPQLRFSSWQPGHDSLGLFEPNLRASTFFSPFSDYKVSLRGHIASEVPWSDPYLHMEWESYLEAAGVTIERDGPWTRYFYKGHILMEARRTASGRKYRVYDTAGGLRGQKTIAIEKPPTVYVSAPENKDSSTWRVQVYGREIPVEIPESNELTRQERVGVLMRIGKRLQSIPESLLAPLLDGAGREKPLKMRVGTVDEGSELGWIPDGRRDNGNYKGLHNIIFLSTWRHHTLYHEIAHAIDDYDVPDSNSTYISESSRSVISEYYTWRLSQIFLSSELVDYEKLISRDTEDDLVSFRNRSRFHFVSVYAAEGSQGVWSQMDWPVEFHAEGMRIFLQALNGQVSWRDYESREPYLRLIGLAYLFKEYSVANIGTVKADAVYSKESFQAVLGVDLDASPRIRSTFDEAYTDYDARISRDPNDAFALYNRGATHYREGRIVEAYEDIQRAHQLDSQFEAPWWLKWQRDNLTAHWPF